MDRVAPLGSDIMSLMVGASCDALDAAMLAFSRSDHLLYASRSIQKFYPVADEYLQPGTSLRDLLNAIFETGALRGVPGTVSKAHISANEWVSERIADMWSERGEKTERLGRERWLSVVTRRTASGIGIMLLRDISAFKKKEERWHDDMERVSMTEDILDALPTPVFVKDRNLTYVAVNKAYCKLHGISHDSILGRNVWDVVDAGIAEHYEAEERQVLETGVPTLQHEELVTAGREVIFVVKHRFRIGKPGHHHVVTLLQDVSEIVGGVRAEGDEDGPETLVAAEIGSQPATAGAAPAAGGAAAGSEEREAGRVLLISTEQTVGAALVSALKGFRVDALQVGSIAEAMLILRAAHEADMTVDLVMVDEADWPGVAATDNLAGVSVLAFGRARPVHFAVADVASVLARSAAHGDSMPGDAFDLGYMPDFPDFEDENAETAFDLEVLVAEDNAVNREVYSQILDGLDVDYQLARDGAEAVRLWEAKRPPLVLMDTTLPLVDGFEATRRIRAIEGSAASKCTIVGVLPHKSEAQAEACMKCGMDATITKPLNVEVLEAFYRHHVLENFPGHQAKNIN